MENIALFEEKRTLRETSQSATNLCQESPEKDLDPPSGRESVEVQVHIEKQAEEFNQSSISVLEQEKRPENDTHEDLLSLGMYGFNVDETLRNRHIQEKE
ncbi:UNVERIFIED_CONTAM: hypothetical protein PYX00_008687 [Menopon gallinae]|uniref:Uncharacterized protein n=1 Tax=Menopon gallinae TaxID=328185 RepID=A0AAW2HNV5_9NEOP